MRPVIRDITRFVPGSHVPSILPEFEESPVGATHFAFNCLILIGPEGEDGEDRFDVFVCSPAWLAANFTAVEATTGRRLFPWARTEPNDRAVFTPGLLLMPTWSLEALAEAIDLICERCQGPDWPTVASRLTRYLDWEYEYKYDEYVDLHPDQFQLPKRWASTGYRRSSQRNRPG
jgi:hypothetical protein